MDSLTRTIFLTWTIVHIIIVSLITFTTRFSFTFTDAIKKFFVSKLDTLEMASQKINFYYNFQKSLDLFTLNLSASLLHSAKLVHFQQFSQSVQGQPSKK